MMESPTVELSRGLEALRLAGLEEGRQETEREQPLTEEDTALLSDVKASTALETFRAGNGNQCDSTERLIQMPSNSTNRTISEQNIPLVFSHLEYTDSVANERVCMCDSVQELQHRLGESQVDLVCTNCGLTRPRNCSISSEQDIIESFNSLHVSSHTSTGAHSQHLVVPTTSMSCRQQAAACENGYLDDTTVDDLAGYFDEIMYLPRPMSEMAELMYT